MPGGEINGGGGASFSGDVMNVRGGPAGGWSSLQGVLAKWSQRVLPASFSPRPKAWEPGELMSEGRRRWRSQLKQRE